MELDSDVYIQLGDTSTRHAYLGGRFRISTISACPTTEDSEILADAKMDEKW